jgi:propionate CoA-transferase
VISHLFRAITRYSTSAFFRRQLGREFDERDIYANFSADRR